MRRLKEIRFGLAGIVLLVLFCCSTSCSLIDLNTKQVEITEEEENNSRRNRKTVLEESIKESVEESVIASIEESVAASEENERVENEETESLIEEENTEFVQVETTMPTAQTQNYNLHTTLYVVNCRESISLRTEPSTSAYAKRQIPLGSAVTYIETIGNGFYKINYLGDEGYALASYLSTDPNQSYTPPAPTTTVQYYNYSYRMKVINCKVSITLRTYPSTSAPEIRQIPLGAYVGYLDEAENGFYYIEYMGERGFALASYLGY